MYKAVIKLKREQLACLIQFAHDEGLDVSLYREEEEASIQKPIQQELPFEIVVGGVYADKGGRVDKIVLNNLGEILPFKGESGRWYTKEGVFNTGKNSDYNLIKRIK